MVLGRCGCDGGSGSGVLVLLLLVLLLLVQLVLLFGHLECQQFLRVQRVQRPQVGDFLQQFLAQARSVWMVLHEHRLQRAFQLFVHAFDEFDIAQAWAICFVKTIKKTVRFKNILSTNMYLTFE